MKNVKKHIFALALAIIIIFALFNPFIGLGHTHSCCELECHICHLALSINARVMIFAFVIALLFVSLVLDLCITIEHCYIAKNQSLISWKVEMLN